MVQLRANKIEDPYWKSDWRKLHWQQHNNGTTLLRWREDSPAAPPSCHTPREAECHALLCYNASMHTYYKVFPVVFLILLALAASLQFAYHGCESTLSGRHTSTARLTGPATSPPSMPIKRHPEIPALATSTMAEPEGKAWRTYENALYEITLKYPTGWLLTSSTNISSSLPVGQFAAEVRIESHGNALSIGVCNTNQCAAAANQQLMIPTSQLSPTIKVMLTVAGRRAWRDVSPQVNGEDSDVLSLGIIFLRDSNLTGGAPNNPIEPQFTPISNWIEHDGRYYNIVYWLASSTENLDEPLMIRDMDTIAQNIEFLN